MSTTRLEQERGYSRASGRSASARRAQLTGVAFVIVTAIGWGLNWPATKFVILTCPPLSARGVSGLAAAAFLFGIAASRGETLTVPPHLWPRLVTASLLNVSAWMGLTTASLLWLPAGQAATLAYTMPVWVTLLAWPVLRERPTSRQIVAILLGLAGVAVQLGGVDLHPDAARLPGMALALSAATLFAVGTVLCKRTPIPLPRFALTAWQVLLGSMPLLAAGLPLEHPHFSSMPAIAWTSLGYTAVISMGLCYVLWYSAVGRLKASSAAIGTLLTPVIGFTASMIVLGDQPSLSQLVSLAMVVGAIVFSVRD